MWIWQDDLINISKILIKCIKYDIERKHLFYHWTNIQKKGVLFMQRDIVCQITGKDYHKIVN